VELDLDVVSYTEAAAEHDRAAERHNKAAGYWARRGDAEWADLERRTARLEREAAKVDRLRARVARRRQV
jgi:hypothetical protein